MFYHVEFEKLRDNQRNDLLFDIKEFQDGIILTEDAKFSGKKIPIYGLFYIGENPEKELFSELYYRNSKGHSYADDEEYMLEPKNNEEIHFNLPIFKNLSGKRLMLPENK
jgi:hypothetical protein